MKCTQPNAGSCKHHAASDFSFDRLRPMFPCELITAVAAAAAEVETQMCPHVPADMLSQMQVMSLLNYIFLLCNAGKGI